MSLPTNRMPGDLIQAVDINQIAEAVNDLSMAVIMTESDHLDNATTPGIYRINTAAIATAVGAPEATSMDVRVLSGPGTAIPIQIAMLHYTSGNWGSSSGMRLYVRRRSATAWTGWGQPFGPADNSLRFMRNLAESDHLDNLTTPGYYSIPSTAVATAVGAPEPILSTVLVIPLGVGLTAQTVTTGNLSGGRGVRIWNRVKSTAWSGWTGPAGNVPGHSHKMMLEDGPGAPGHLIQLDHYANGSGAGNGQTYGIDIHNYDGARQAVVIHQYSDAREAFRLDNTDSNAGIYINNTENLSLNPDGTGEGAPFLKFHPYNMGNFLDFAYLMDDLTFVNDTTKTWSFQAKTGPITQWKNADGVVVAEVTQDGTFTGSGGEAVMADRGLLSTTDLDTLTTTGFYRQVSNLSTSSRTSAHYPDVSSTRGVLTVVRLNASTVTQRYDATLHGSVWLRDSVSGVWGAWVLIGPSAGGGGFAWPAPPAYRWVGPSWIYGSPATKSHPYLEPALYETGDGWPCSAVAVEITTASTGAGDTLSIRLYGSLLDGGIDTANVLGTYPIPVDSTGTKTVTLPTSLALPAGRVYVDVVVDGAAPASNVSFRVASPTGPNSAYGGSSVSSILGNYPPFPTGVNSSTNNYVILAALRRAA